MTELTKVCQDCGGSGNAAPRVVCKTCEDIGTLPATVADALAILKTSGVVITPEETHRAIVDELASDLEAARHNNGELRAGLDNMTTELHHVLDELAKARADRLAARHSARYFAETAIEKAGRDGGNCPYCGEFRGHASTCPAVAFLESVV